MVVKSVFSINPRSSNCSVVRRPAIIRRREMPNFRTQESSAVVITKSAAMVRSMGERTIIFIIQWNWFSLTIICTKAKFK